MSQIYFFHNFAHDIMRIYRKILFLLVLFAFSITGSKAQVADAEPLCASLLTCTPGTDAYAHFGHTALRVYGGYHNVNVVFNYGCFDMTGSDFVMNFVRGNTNYKLEAEGMDYFYWRYAQMGNGVTEQQLNLTPDEAERLFQLLLQNVRPENQTYLYNWLYDNCTERARDIIEKAVNGKVEYRRNRNTKTARTMLHDNLANAPWLAFGIDLLLGSEIDQPLDPRVQMFIPSEFQDDADEAIIVGDDGTERKLIASSELILEENLPADPDLFLSPILTFSLLLLIAIALTVLDFKKGCLRFWYFDAALHFVQGCVGIIISYLFFFSIHPAVDSNWYIIIFNPLYILYALYLIYCHRTGKSNKMRYVVFAVTLAFCIAPVLQLQSYQLAALPMYLSLLLRTAVNTRLR